MQPRIVGQFDTFEDWVNTATSKLAHRTDSFGVTIPAVCIDAKGRRCYIGGHFMRARDDNSFPVIYFWDFIPKDTEDPKLHNLAEELQ